MTALAKKPLALLSFLFLIGVLHTQAAQVGSGPFANAKVYPNPWRIDQHGSIDMTFNGLPAGTHVKIFTISAHLVRELTADSSGTATWNRTNRSGQAVASGIYIYLLIDPQGNDSSGKLAIIK